MLRSLTVQHICSTTRSTQVSQALGNYKPYQVNVEPRELTRTCATCRSSKSHWLRALAQVAWLLKPLRALHIAHAAQQNSTTQQPLHCNEELGGAKHSIGTSFIRT